MPDDRDYWPTDRQGDWIAHRTIDYRKPTHQVYTSFARDFLKSKNDYSILSYLNRESLGGAWDQRIQEWKNFETECEAMTLKANDLTDWEFLARGQAAYRANTVLWEEAKEARSDAEAADGVGTINHQKQCEDAARPVRYLWPALMSLWQADEP